MMAGNAKRVAVFVTGAFYASDGLDPVSGHVQIPLKAAQGLRTAGHDVTLITTKQPGTHCIPGGLGEGLKVRIVQHASERWPQHRIHLGKAVRQVFQLRSLMNSRRFDIVHFFGGPATGWLLCLLKSLGLSAQAFYSPVREPSSCQSRWRSPVTRRAFRSIGRVLPMSEYVSRTWIPIVGERKVQTLHPGVVRQCEHHASDSGARRDSVLFWRCARHDNGVDVAMASFRRLAPRYPHLRFVFAVRPHGPYEDSLRKLADEIENIDVHVYPYEDPVSLPALFARAMFVVQPFRRLTINPQLSILESLYAGLPVIATDVESNPELVHHEQTGLLIPPGDEQALSAAIQRLLTDTQARTDLARNACDVTQRQWNWQRFDQQLLHAYDT